LDCRFQA